MTSATGHLETVTTASKVGYRHARASMHAADSRAIGTRSNGPDSAVDICDERAGAFVQNDVNVLKQS
jgi:hypothetical protein